MALQEEPAAGPANGDVKVVVRAAVRDDAADIARLSQELLAFYGLPVPNQRSYMAHAIADRAFGDRPTIEILLAHADGQAAGFLAYSESFAVANCVDSVFIQDLFVIRRARRLGIGRRLMIELARICVARGIGQLDWTMDPWNAKARVFYEELGPLLHSDKVYYRMLGPRIAELLRV